MYQSCIYAGLNNCTDQIALSNKKSRGNKISSWAARFSKMLLCSDIWDPNLFITVHIDIQEPNYAGPPAGTVTYVDMLFSNYSVSQVNLWNFQVKMMSLKMADEISTSFWCILKCMLSFSLKFVPRIKIIFVYIPFAIGKYIKPLHLFCAVLCICTDSLLLMCKASLIYAGFIMFSVCLIRKKLHIIYVTRLQQGFISQWSMFAKVHCRVQVNNFHTPHWVSAAWLQQCWEMKPDKYIIQILSPDKHWNENIILDRMLMTGCTGISVQPVIKMSKWWFFSFQWIYWLNVMHFFVWINKIWKNYLNL